MVYTITLVKIERNQIDQLKLLKVFKEGIIELSERDAAAICGTTIIGSFLNDVVGCARNLGFAEADHFSGGLEALLAEDLPFIINLEVPNNLGIMHAEAIIGVSARTITFADPTNALQEVGRDDFLKHWKGQVIRLGKPSKQKERTPKLSAFTPEDLRR